MKKTLLYILGIPALCLLIFVILMMIKGRLQYEVNIIDLCSFFVTIILAIIVVYLTKPLEKKDFARDIISKDLLELCAVYEQNLQILKMLEKKEISLDNARSEVNMTFHRGDIIADMITKEVKESFPSFSLDIEKITTSYYKGITGGKLQFSDFQIDNSYQKEHETKLRNTITEIRLIIHRLIKEA